MLKQPQDFKTSKLEKHFIIREQKIVYTDYKKVKEIVFKKPETIYNYFYDELKKEGREVFIIVFLNSQNQVIGYNKMFSGTVDKTFVHPREILKHALFIDATRLIIVHNHPSGNQDPSEKDIQITKRINAGLELVEIELLDHIIIGENTYCSMRERGIL